MYIHVYIYIYIYIHLSLSLSVSLSLYINIYTNIFICIFAFMFMLIFLSTTFYFCLAAVISDQVSRRFCSRGCFCLRTTSHPNLSTLQVASLVEGPRTECTPISPEGLSTQCLRLLTPNHTFLMFLGIRNLIYWLLGPSGLKKSIGPVECGRFSMHLTVTRPT